MSYIPILSLSYNESTLSGTLISLVFDYDLSETEAEDLDTLLTTDDLLMSVCKYAASILYTFVSDACTQDIHLSTFYDQFNRLVELYSEEDTNAAMQDVLDSSDLEKLESDYNALSTTVSNLLSDFVSEHCPDLEESIDDNEDEDVNSLFSTHTLLAVPSKQHPRYSEISHQNEYDILNLYLNDETSQVMVSLNTDILSRHLFTNEDDFYSFIFTALKLFICRLIFIKYDDDILDSAVFFRCLCVIRDELRNLADESEDYTKEAPLFDMYLDILESEG